jgi:hypothetical protein
MMVALARPGDIDDSVTVRFDEEPKSIGVRLRGAPAGAASVAGVAAPAQDIDRNEDPGCSRTLAAVEIFQRRERRCRQK